MNEDWLSIREPGLMFCWLSGCTESMRPDGYYGPWKLQIAHIASGGGRAVRVADRRACILLSPIAHDCHVSDAHRLPTKTINGITYATIDERHSLWLKRKFDNEYYDPEFLQTIWIGNLPTPVRPPEFWCEMFFRNQGLAI